MAGKNMKELSLNELKELGRRHWKEHRPKLFRELQKSGYLDEALTNAAQNTLDAYQNLKAKLLKSGDTECQAQEIAWEMVRQEWLLRPSEEQPDLETPTQSPSQLDDVLQSQNPPRSIPTSE
jgi:hypothetical protein